MRWPGRPLETGNTTQDTTAEAMLHLPTPSACRQRSTKKTHESTLTHIRTHKTYPQKGTEDRCPSTPSRERSSNSELTFTSHHTHSNNNHEIVPNRTAASQPPCSLLCGHSVNSLLWIVLRGDSRADRVRPSLHRGPYGVVPKAEELLAVQAERGTSVPMSQEARVGFSQRRPAPAF